MTPEGCGALAPDYARSPKAHIVLAGLMMGSFVVPMKVMPHWDFENTWLLFCFMALVILPSLVAVLTVPNLGQVLLTSPPRSLILTTLCDLGYGCGSVLFGLGAATRGKRPAKQFSFQRFNKRWQATSVGIG